MHIYIYIYAHIPTLVSLCRALLIIGLICPYSAFVSQMLMANLTTRPQGPPSCSTGAIRISICLSLSLSRYIYIYIYVHTHWVYYIYTANFHTKNSQTKNL